MTSRILIVLLSIIVPSAILAQESRRNENWVIGLAPLVKYNFSPTLQITQVPNMAGANSVASISDTNGDLLLTSNGWLLYDKDGYFIENGTLINCPYGDKLADYYGYYSDFDQMSIILPKKGNQYYVFAVGMSDSAATKYLNHTESRFDVLNYSVVDMDSNAGKGKVIAKNVVLMDSQKYVKCDINAVRHGNGKDWWLCKPDCENHRFQLFLVKSDTIEGPYYQYVPTTDTVDYCVWMSNIKFSEDGSKMACSMYGNRENGVYISPNRVDLFNFDRCTGSLSYRNHYEVPFDTTTYSNDDFKLGICFSPNGKMVFMSSIYSIYQIDTEDTNRNNAIYITGPDTNDINFPWYNHMAIAPDGRIYIGTFGISRPYMSYIAYPDVKGLGCGFTGNGIWQPYTNLANPPNMPNYGLGAICWPLSVAPSPTGEGHSELLVYPNPTTAMLYFKHANRKRKELYNNIGQLLLSTLDEHMDVSNIPRGMYYIRCENQSVKVLIE